jgi:hypothetical protein
MWRRIEEGEGCLERQEIKTPELLAEFLYSKTRIAQTVESVDTLT